MRESVTGRSRSRAAAAVIALLVLVVLLVTIVDRAYITPRRADHLHSADAVVVLGGNAYARFEYGLDLARRGLTDQVVLSNSVGADDERMQRLCHTRIPGVQVTCFLPQPWTTRGEARALRGLATDRRWHDIIVVTTTAHVERARFILERCYSDRLQMVDFPEQRGVGASLFGWGYQSAGWLKALAQTGC